MTSIKSGSKRLVPPAPDPGAPSIDRFRMRHLAPVRHRIATEQGPADVIVDEAESPLAWLARRRGRDGCALIGAHQLLAGERLRVDFTRAWLMPRTTSDWTRPVARASRGGPAEGTGAFTEAMIAARQRVRQALRAVGPEFAGLLLDVCCFLKGLEDIERERAWPARSAKVVLQLALEKLARHYGYAPETRGSGQSTPRVWLADDVDFQF